jgi:uncharacterized protein with PIN domain
MAGRLYKQGREGDDFRQPGRNRLHSAGSISGILRSMGVRGQHGRRLRWAEFRFYRELNDFLPAHRRQAAFRESFTGTPAVRDTIQAIGVPHSAVDLILVDGESVGFTHRLQGGERVAVYPEFERLDISPLQRLRPRPLRRTRFILDVHLGRLARYLRLLGFDSAYDRGWHDDEIIDRGLAEKRIILTRDLGILKQSRVTHGYWLRSDVPAAQVREVVDALDLRGQFQPFARCMECNGEIHAVDKPDLQGLVEQDILQRFDEFRQCPDCRRVYWRGSHYEQMQTLVNALVDRVGTP